MDRNPKRTNDHTLSGRSRAWRPAWAVALLGVTFLLPGRADTNEVTRVGPAADSVWSFDNSSYVELNGSATLHKWHCSTARINGGIRPGVSSNAVFVFFADLAAQHRLTTTAVEQIIARSRNVSSARVRVPVAGFDCGNPDMERDMHRSLGKREHPFIRYEFQRLKGLRLADRSENEAGGEVVLQTYGQLSLAGVTRDVAMDVLARVGPDGKVRAQATLDVKMTHFGVDPPSAFFGLLRAYDPVSISFFVTLLPGRDT